MWLIKGVLILIASDNDNCWKLRGWSCYHTRRYRHWTPHSSLAVCAPKEGLNNGISSADERGKSESRGIHSQFGAGAGHRAFILRNQWLILSKIGSNWEGEAKSLGNLGTHSETIWYHTEQKTENTFIVTVACWVYNKIKCSLNSAKITHSSHKKVCKNHKLYQTI